MNILSPRSLANRWKNASNLALSAGIFILLLLLCTIGMVCAFFQSMDAKSNIITIGENVTKIEETFIPPEAIHQGGRYTKAVSVKNLGSVPCYVRVFAEFSDPEQADALIADFNNTDWSEKQTDGYYYYNEPLAAGQTTPPLFTSLYAKKKLSDFYMILYSESVQISSFSTPISAFQAFFDRRENEK